MLIIHTETYFLDYCLLAREQTKAKSCWQKQLSPMKTKYEIEKYLFTLHMDAPSGRKKKNDENDG